MRRLPAARVMGAALIVACAVTVFGPSARAQTETTTTTDTTPDTTTTTDPTTTTTVDPSTTSTTVSPTTTTSVLATSPTTDTTVGATATVDTADAAGDAEPAPQRVRNGTVYVGSVSRLSSAQRAALEDYLAAEDRLARARAAGAALTVVLEPTAARSARPRARASKAAWRLVTRTAALTVERAVAGVSSLQVAEAAIAEAEAHVAWATAALERVAGGDPMIRALLTGTPPPGDGFGRRIIDAQAGQGNPPSLTGLVALPIPGAPIVSRFGYRVDPIDGDVAFHAGIDIGASQGTPILAAAAGTVLISGDGGGYGKAVVLDHGSSLATVYGHLVSFTVTPGQVVAAGDVIGYVGSTGLSTGPHLHFEVRLRGVAADPIPLLIG